MTQRVDALLALTLALLTPLAPASDEPALESPRVWFSLPQVGGTATVPASIDAIESGEASTARSALVAAVAGRTQAHEATRAALLRAFESFKSSRDASEFALLEPSASSLAWLAQFAPTLLLGVLDEELGRRRDDEAFVEFAMNVVDAPRIALVAATLPSPVVLELSAGASRIGDIVRRSVCRAAWSGTASPWLVDGNRRGVAQIQSHWAVDCGVRRPHPRPFANSPELDAIDQGVLGAAVDQVLAAELPDLRWLRAVLEPCAALPTLRRYVERRLRPFLDDPSEHGDEAAFLLAHLGFADERIRARCVTIMDSAVEADDSWWEGVPCLVEHDDATRDALRRLTRRMQNPWDLLAELVHAGLLADPADPFAAEVFARLDEAKSDYCWWRLYSWGLRVKVSISDRDPPEVVVQKVALAWNAAGTTDADRDALRIRFEEAALAIDGYGGNPAHATVLWAELATDLGIRSKRLVDRAVALASNFNSSTYTQTAQCAYLRTCTIDAEQRSQLCSLESMFGEFDADILGVFADQGRGALTRVPRIRAQLESTAKVKANGSPMTMPRAGTNLDVFETILAITDAEPEDRALLAQAIRYGTRAERVRACRIVERHRVDGDDIRAALAHARGDLEPCVRDAAAAACR